MNVHLKNRGKEGGRVSVMKLKKAYLLYVLSTMSLVGELQSSYLLPPFDIIVNFSFVLAKSKFLNFDQVYRKMHQHTTSY